MAHRKSARTTTEELVAFELATRDLVGLALSSVEPMEVSLPQFRLLLVLHERGELSSTQCAEAMGVVGSSVTRLSDRLLTSGHVRRGTDPGNRSVVTLELTGTGRRLVEQVTSRRRRALAEALDHLDPAERATCAAALAKLHEMLAVTTPDSPAGPLPL